MVAVIVPAEGDRKIRPFLRAEAGEYAPEFSPDGRWIAYTSMESGRPEIYVHPASSGASGKWQISTDGGGFARWARSGRELFYRNGDRVMAVEIKPGPSFRARTRRVLFEGRYVSSYDVSADGKRFLLVKLGGEQEGSAAQVHIGLEWFDEIRRRVRAGAGG